ncbi:MAG: hypothetical protein ACI35P_02680 [Bacillus sp. (in: firmicutes)]
MTNLFVQLVNPKTKESVNRKAGFSWTTVFFGFFVPLLRQDWKWAIIMFIAGLLTSGLSCFAFCFLYNKFNITEMLNQGFLPANEESKQQLIKKGWAGHDLPVYQAK